MTQPAPAPRFSGTPAAACRPVRAAGADTRSLLAELGYGDEEIACMLRSVAHQDGE
jgi:alpha-methylacyl-CoA racemase